MSSTCSQTTKSGPPSSARHVIHCRTACLACHTYLSKVLTPVTSESACANRANRSPCEAPNDFFTTYYLPGNLTTHDQATSICYRCWATSAEKLEHVFETASADRRSEE